MEETSNKKSELFGKVFGAMSQSVVMSSPVFRQAIDVADMFRKPDEESKETRLGNILGSIKDYMSNQSKVIRNIVGVVEFTKDILDDEKKKDETKDDKSKTKDDGAKPKGESSIIDYLEKKDNPYITAFNESNVLLERIAKSVEAQLEYTRRMLKLDEEASEMAKIKTDLDKVSRSDAARARALQQPRDAQGRFTKDEKKEDGDGLGFDDILTGLGGLGVLKGGKGALGRLIRGGAKAAPKITPRIAPGAAGAAAAEGSAAAKGAGKGLGKGLGKVGGALKGLGRFLGPLNLALGAYDIYNTVTDDELDAREKTIGVSETVGGMGGAAAGAAAGAAIGSVVPVVGTAIGGIAGGLLGYFGGSWLGETAGEAIAGDGVEDNLVPEYDAMGNPTGGYIEAVPSTPPETEPTTPPIEDKLSDDEFNKLMARRTELLTRGDQILFDENNNLKESITPEQQQELDIMDKELDIIHKRLEQDSRYRGSISIVPQGNADEIKPSASLNPTAIQPDYAAKQSQLDYITGQTVPTTVASAAPPSNPVMLQNQSPTTINSGGNVTNIIMNNDSLALPQQAFNLPMALA